MLGTDNAVKGADNAVKGADNAVKGTDDAVKSTDNDNNNMALMLARVLRSHECMPSATIVLDAARRLQPHAASWHAWSTLFCMLHLLVACCMACCCSHARARWPAAMRARGEHCTGQASPQSIRPAGALRG